MALIACPECGKQVSSVASACPSCAYPLQSIDGVTAQAQGAVTTQSTLKTESSQIADVSGSISNTQQRHRLFKWAAWAGITAVVGFGLYYFLYAMPQNQVREQLTDADSAVFRNRILSGAYFCADVNARTRIGGFAGFIRVIVKRNEFVFFEGEEPVGKSSLAGVPTLEAIELKIEIAKVTLELLQTARAEGNRGPLDKTALAREKVFSKMWAEQCK